MNSADISSREYSDNTERARKQAISDFLRVTGASIRDASNEDVEKWISSMEHRRLSTATRRQRISILNQINPKVKTVLPHRNYSEKYYLNSDQLIAFIYAVPNTENGILDLFMLAVISNGLRSTQARLLQWKHVHQSDNCLTVKLPSKIVILPTSLKELIKKLITRTNNSEDYIFRATSSHYKYLPNRNHTSIEMPLSAAEINRRIKKYARRALLDDEKISARTLLYTSEQLGAIEINRIFDSVGKRFLPQPVRWKSVLNAATSIGLKSNGASHK